MLLTVSLAIDCPRLSTSGVEGAVEVEEVEGVCSSVLTLDDIFAGAITTGFVVLTRAAVLLFEEEALVARGTAGRIRGTVALFATGAMTVDFLTAAGLVALAGAFADEVDGALRVGRVVGLR